MGDTVVADFITDVIPDTGRFDEPVRGRVLMNRSAIVLVTPEDRVTFAIDNIFDIAYGSAPSDLRDFFEDTVSLAYEDGQTRRIALIEGADETVQKFTNLLFKGVLNKTTVAVKHPAKVGGRITNNSFQSGVMYVEPTAVKFKTGEHVIIDISTVTQFERRKREVSGASRPVLSVSHIEESQTVTSEIAVKSDRKMNVLGRFLRIEYSQLREELSDISLREEEIEALVSLYSGASAGSLAGMLGVDTIQVTTLVRKLSEKGLLEETKAGWTLTPIGKLAVGEHIESVNL